MVSLGGARSPQEWCDQMVGLWVISWSMMVHKLGFMGHGGAGDDGWLMGAMVHGQSQWADGYYVLNNAWMIIIN